MIRYQEYRTEYISTQKRTYFNSHKDEEWYFFLLSLRLLLNKYTNSCSSLCTFYEFCLSVQVKRQISSNKLTHCHRTVSTPQKFSFASTFTANLSCPLYTTSILVICKDLNMVATFVGGTNLQGSWRRIFNLICRVGLWICKSCSCIFTS